MCCVGNCGDCCVGNCSNCTNCGDKAAIEERKHNEDVASELAKMRKDMASKSDEFEQDIIKLSNSPIVEIINILKKANGQTFGDRKLNINIDFIERRINENNKQIKGILGRYYAEQLNTTNPTLVTITSNRNKTLRNQAYNEFIHKIECTGKRKLGEKAESVVKENLQLIKYEVSMRLEEIYKDLQNAEKEYKAIQEAGNKDTKEKELLKAKYLYQLEIYNIMNTYISKKL